MIPNVVYFIFYSNDQAAIIPFQINCLTFVWSA